MTQQVPYAPARVARHDLTARQAVVASCVAMTAIILLDLIDGRLGMLYSVGFVLIAITAPLAVDARSLLPTGVLPPALLIGSLLAVSLVAPGAIQVNGMAEDAGTIARLIAGTIDHGLTLAVGHVLALLLMVWRIATAD